MNATPPKTLDDVCEFIVDCLHATAPTQDEGYPLIRTPNIGRGRLILEGVQRVDEHTYQHWTRRAVPQKHDLILAREAPAGNVAIIKNGQTVCLGQRTVHLRPDAAQVDPDFLCYFLLHPKQQGLLLAGETGATSKHVNMRDIRRLPLQGMPGRDVQTRAGALLAAYDDLIENNTRRIKLLGDAARLLYEEWFVRLRFPGHEHTPIKDGVPKGWQKTHLGDHITVVRGKSYRSPELVETGGKPFVNLKCIARDGGFRLDGLKRFSGDHKPEQVVHPGDIVIAVTDMTQERRIVAHAARVPAAMTDPGVISMDTVKAVPHSTVDATWVYGMLRFSCFSKEVRQHATGTNVLHLKPARISEYATVFPPRLLQDRYGEAVESLLRQIDTLWLQKLKLQEARDLLLPRLMSGEVAV